MLVKKIVAGLILIGFLFSHGLVICASSHVSPTEATKETIIVETIAPTMATPAPTVETTAPQTELTRPPVEYINYVFIDNLQKTEIENQLALLYDYINYLNTYDEVDAEINRINEIINLYETQLNLIVEKENHYNKCYSEYPEATIIWFYMKDNFGWPDAVCAGVMGNIMAEIGGGNCEGALGFGDRWQIDTSSGFGMFQWMGDREARIKSVYGQCPSIEQQLQFMYYEVTGTNETIATPRYYDELSAMFQCDSPEQNALTFAIWFEGCKSFSYGARQNYAQFAYNYFVY